MIEFSAFSETWIKSMWLKRDEILLERLNNIFKQKHFFEGLTEVVHVELKGPGTLPQRKKKQA